MVILWSCLSKGCRWWWSSFVKGEIVISKLTKSSTGRDNSEFETSNFTTSSENILFLPKIFCPAKPGDAKEKIASVLEKLPCDCWKGKAATRDPSEISLGLLKSPLPCEMLVYLRSIYHSCYAPLRRPYENWPKIYICENPSCAGSVVEHHGVKSSCRNKQRAI